MQTIPYLFPSTCPWNDEIHHLSQLHFRAPPRKTAATMVTWTSTPQSLGRCSSPNGRKVQGDMEILLLLDTRGTPAIFSKMHNVVQSKVYL